MQTLYIYSSSREFVQQATGFDNQQGVIYEEIGGEHAIWATRVSFLPSLLSECSTRWGRDIGPDLAQ